MADLSEIIGRRIIAVVTTENQRPPRYQVFLVFEDGMYYEFYGREFTGCNGANPGGLEGALKAARRVGGEVTVYPEKLDAKASQLG